MEHGYWEKRAHELAHELHTRSLLLTQWISQVNISQDDTIQVIMLSQCRDTTDEDKSCFRSS